MNRNYIMLLVLVLTVALVACGGGETAVSEPETTTIDVTTLGPTIDVATVQALQGRDDVVFIDVREQWEYNEGHIPNITLIPMGEIEARLSEIPTDKEVILTCRSGNRSGQVTDFLRQKGFDNVHNMEGGIIAWQNAGYTVEQ